MVKKLRLADAVCGGALDGRLGGVDQNSTVEIRTGDVGDPNAVATGTLLITFTLVDADPYPAAQRVTPGSGGAEWEAGFESTMAGTPVVANAVQAGTAGHANVKNAAGTTQFLGSVGTSAGQFDFVISDVTIENGAQYELRSSQFVEKSKGPEV